MRRAPAEVRRLEPDPVYQSILVTQVINKLVPDPTSHDEHAKKVGEFRALMCKGTIGSRRWPRESMARRIASWPGSII